MISVDTNVLVRVLVDDPGATKQVLSARALVERSKRIFICQPVQIETAWVLTRSYGFGKAALLSVLDELQENLAFELEHAEIFAQALEVYRDTNMGFADAIILTIARIRNLSVASFDRKLARHSGASLLK